MRNTNNSVNVQSALLLTAIENFIVGLVIVAQNGTVLHKNKQAQSLMSQMSGPAPKGLPHILWSTCRSLMAAQEDQEELFSAGYNIVLEDELPTDRGSIHIRVQWFDDKSDSQHRDCFLITLEDRQHSLTAIINQESQSYGLTVRETDVWYLKRIGNSYKEIANALYISENTVKKHLKNIYSKKEQSSWSI